jgi:hypothetical protein
MCSSEAFYNKRMSFPISSNDTDFLETSQVVDDVFTFAKVDFLQGIANFDFLVFDHTTKIGDMRRRRLKREVLFDLPNQLYPEQEAWCCLP